MNPNPKYIRYAGSTPTSRMVVIDFEPGVPDEVWSPQGAAFRSFLVINGYLPRKDYFPGDESDDKRMLWPTHRNGGVRYEYTASSPEEAGRALDALSREFNIPISVPL